MSTTFSADFFKANRERLRDLFTGTAPIILTANGLLQRNSDVTYPFRQDSSFWYLTGIEEPDVILVIDKSKEYLIVPERDERRAAFDGAIDDARLREVSGVDMVLSAKIGWKQLQPRLKKVKHVATLAPANSYVAQHGVYTNPARTRLVEQLHAVNADIELLDLRPHITRLRVVKQPVELTAIREAIALTVDSLTKVKRRLEKFETEYQLEAALTGYFRAVGADHAYSPIIASGKNACTLHYVQNSAAIMPQDIVLLDVGAEVSNYAADITRSYISGDESSKRQQQVFDMVLVVQDYAISLLKPGVTLREYEDMVVQFMGEKLRELGLIKTIDDENVRKYYPHATSHFLGLDVHDVGEYDAPLEPGMVLTVEPGIYIPEESIGIRIEDNIVITEEGSEVLSKALPRVLH